ncbi:MAG: sensor histidine kinase, partial [Candidatus Marinimicrobia bacterium]|nr:sensor histidine kinase [Candidatus Neomarinimicrobiota bacterium]
MQNSKNKILSGNLINDEMAHYEHLSGNNLNTEHFLFGQIANSKQKLTLDLPSSETSFSKLFEHFQNSMNVFDDKSKNRQLFLKTIEHFHSFYRISRKYSAIERSKQIELKKLDFQTFFNRLHHHFRQFIETDHYKFDFTSEIRDYFPIMGHPESLKTLIYELLRNAKNASKTGSIVTLSANIAFAETISHLNVQKLKGKYICIKISDKGSGMSTSELALSTKDYYSGNPERN